MIASVIDEAMRPSLKASPFLRISKATALVSGIKTTQIFIMSEDLLTIAEQTLKATKKRTTERTIEYF